MHLQFGGAARHVVILSAQGPLELTSGLATTRVKDFSLNTLPIKLPADTARQAEPEPSDSEATAKPSRLTQGLTTTRVENSILGRMGYF